MSVIEVVKSDNVRVKSDKQRHCQFTVVYFGRTLESLELYLSTRDDDLPELWVVGKDENVRAASYSSLYEWVVYMRKVFVLFLFYFMYIYLFLFGNM